ncbi:hypothetical protein DNU06_11740 [Putridiphycobacter roseus]|uniref:Methyltransferase n=1 Tax=Putridiphycobacter roseus TaxID=2219161 RepID=A0A2W1NBR1_9FLAO|nr:class I SAM-dependent methyltransferase [Putridiphycobacter roseus]PZE16523.1 hypothetical protein DNU06_11740 [Putridiphycobacter roseus]
MISSKTEQIDTTIRALYKHARFDKLKIMKGLAKSMSRSMQPSDFEDAYLSINQEQGEYLTDLIVNQKFKNIIEFGTSFGISTLFLARGAMKTNGKIITTELLASKAEQAILNFKKAGVSDLIEVRTGDAMETLKKHNNPIDLLLLDGWKNLYLPLFKMLEPNFTKETNIYVDNADMPESKTFLKNINPGKYKITSLFGGKAMLITIKKQGAHLPLIKQSNLK